MGIFVGALVAGLSSPGILNDNGTFDISVAGQKIGYEKFEIRAAQNGIIAKAEVELRAESEGKARTFRTFPDLVLSSELRPESYTWVQSGSQNSRLHVDFNTSPAKVQYHTVDGKNDLREFGLPKDVVILDDNVLYQYELLVLLYDKTSRGPQAFHAFIPQEAMPGQVNVLETGREQVKIGGKTKTLRHLAVTTDLARIDLWVDAQGRLQRIAIPAVQFDAVRQD